jgi:AraC-like DNA-binding protein
LLGFALRHSDGQGSGQGPHVHAEGQLAFIETGLLQVNAGGYLYLAGGQLAIWVPSGAPHASLSNRTRMISLFVPPTAVETMPQRVTTVSPPAPLRSLVAWLADEFTTSPAEAPVLLAAAIALMRKSAPALRPLGVCSMLSKGLSQIADALTGTPDDGRKMEDWARCLGISARSLLRRVRSETGLSWRDWRRQLVLDWAARELISTQSDVTSIALGAGYATPSAFAAAFKERCGVSPSAWRRQAEGGC